MGQVMKGHGRAAVSIRFSIVLVAALMLFPMLSTPSLAVSTSSVVVEGDDGFLAAGFSGSGTLEDPYELNGLQIDATQKFHGMFIANTTKHFRIVDCTVTDAYTPDRDFLNISASGSGIILSNVTNATIIGFHAEYNVRGVTVVDSREVTVSSSSFYFNVVAGVYVNSCVDGSCQISNCTFGDNLIGISLEDCQGVTIRDNEANAGSTGVSLRSVSAPCAANRLIDNLVSEQLERGILMTGAQNRGNIVQGNRVLDVPNGDGMFIEQGTVQQLISNQVRGCRHAIRVGTGVEGSTIALNSLSNNTYGVRLEPGADMNTVANNSIANGTYGVYIAPSEGNLVENNSILSMAQGSSPVGIYLGVGAVRNATLSGNVITACGVGIRAAANNVEQRVSGLLVLGNRVGDSLKQGMYLVQVNDSQVSGNIFEWNALEAIYLVSGSGNDIQGNAFLFNKASGRTYSPLRVQAYCGEAQNNWNIGSGNLWADWRSPDANEDGVVDLPYLIPSGCQDSFPLTSIPGLDIADDIIPPEVIWYAPQGASADHDATVNMTFSDDMDQGSVNVTVNNVLRTGIWDDRGLTLNITLEYDTEYQVKVNGKDLAGNHMSEFQWTFSTEGPNATLSGRIIDEEGNGIAGATVTVWDISIITGEDGNFLSMLAPGNFTLSVSLDGYEAMTIEVQMLPGQDLDLGDVVLISVPDDPSDPPWLIIGGAVLIASMVASILVIRQRRRR